MKVLIDGKYLTWTDEPVQAVDLYDHIQIIHPNDYIEYNFTAFKRLTVNGLTVTRQ
jgi:hypothetical protein